MTPTRKSRPRQSPRRAPAETKGVARVMWLEVPFRPTPKDYAGHMLYSTSDSGTVPVSGMCLDRFYVLPADQYEAAVERATKAARRAYDKAFSHWWRTDRSGEHPDFMGPALVAALSALNITPAATSANKGRGK